MVCQNEGVYTISNLLKTNLKDKLDQVAGLGYRDEGSIVLNSPSSIVAKEDLSIELPGIAWDKLPMDQYRTSLWHAYSNDCQRQPFAALRHGVSNSLNGDGLACWYTGPGLFTKSVREVLPESVTIR